MREIDATPGRYGGRDKAQGGKVLGIIGSIFLVLGIIAIIGFVALAASVSDDPSRPTPSTGPERLRAACRQAALILDQSSQPTSTGSLTSRMPKRRSTPSRISRASASRSAVVAPPRLVSASVCLVESRAAPSP